MYGEHVVIAALLISSQWQSTRKTSLHWELILWDILYYHIMRGIHVFTQTLALHKKWHLNTKNKASCGASLGLQQSVKNFHPFFFTAWPDGWRVKIWTLSWNADPPHTELVPPCRILRVFVVIIAAKSNWICSFISQKLWFKFAMICNFCKHFVCFFAEILWQ